MKKIPSSLSSWEVIKRTGGRATTYGKQKQAVAEKHLQVATLLAPLTRCQCGGLPNASGCLCAYIMKRKDMHRSTGTTRLTSPILKSQHEMLVKPNATYSWPSALRVEFDPVPKLRAPPVQIRVGQLETVREQNTMSKKSLRNPTIGKTSHSQ